MQKDFLKICPIFEKNQLNKICPVGTDCASECPGYDTNQSYVEVAPDRAIFMS